MYAIVLDLLRDHRSYSVGTARRWKVFVGGSLPEEDRKSSRVLHRFSERSDVELVLESAVRSDSKRSALTTDHPALPLGIRTPQSRKCEKRSEKNWEFSQEDGRASSASHRLLTDSQRPVGNGLKIEKSGKGWKSIRARSRRA